VVADQGVALLSRSAWNGKPDKVLATFPHSAFTSGWPIPPGEKATLALGAENVNVSKGEIGRLAGAITSVTGLPFTAPPPVPLPPAPSSPS